MTFVIYGDDFTQILISLNEDPFYLVWFDPIDAILGQVFGESLCSFKRFRYLKTVTVVNDSDRVKNAI